MAHAIPIVACLVLDGEPHLVANACRACGARYFDRRDACARCGGPDFAVTPLATTGTVRTFSIVHQGPPGVATPYVSGVVDLDGGGRVRTTLRGVEPAPDAVRPGMAVRLVTFVAGTDDEGNEAIGFAFAPE